MTHDIEGKSFQLAIRLHMNKAGLLSLGFKAAKVLVPFCPPKLVFFAILRKKSKWLPFEK